MATQTLTEKELAALPKELRERILGIQSKAEMLEKAANAPLRYKVGEKGGVSVYGFGQFPVTLYADQWERLDADVENRKAFIEANRSVLKTKAEAQAAENAKGSGNGNGAGKDSK